MARNQDRNSGRDYERNMRRGSQRFSDEEYDHYQYRDGFGRSTRADREARERVRSADYNRNYPDDYRASRESEHDAYLGIERNYNLGNGTSMRRSMSGNDFDRNEESWERSRRPRDRTYGLGSYRENDFVRNYPNHAYDYGMSENRGHYGKGPKGWKRSDERIRDEVCEVLNDSYRVDASDIDVAVKEGIVTLSGSVDAREVKLEAERCAESIRGVQDVRNELRIVRNEQERSSLS